ncbi:hypothetical protein [Myroides pelagicus]|uniref:Cytochrome C n=1 Tax=Myroides pelagicus TaxID=270914 RepID=A0A7K1GP57_9FLAO|nr:hypothetical protein [Myroides pelagicus]MEC4113600.1 hypothetical protein [Myroides pelagicus]MTH30626.1 hypothetical protein [Myroides pelagicus]
MVFRNRILLLTVLFVVFSSCKEQKQTEIEEETSFQMYNLSPMAALMEQMYGQMAHAKEVIEQGSEQIDLGEFPVMHNELLTTELTDPRDRDFFFTDQAEKFLILERKLYASSKETIVEDYNAVVNSCLACHIKKCGGPIPRIKKLFIR